MGPCFSHFPLFPCLGPFINWSLPYFIGSQTFHAPKTSILAFLHLFYKDMMLKFPVNADPFITLRVFIQNPIFLLVFMPALSIVHVRFLSTFKHLPPVAVPCPPPALKVNHAYDHKGQSQTHFHFYPFFT